MIINSAEAHIEVQGDVLLYDLRLKFSSVCLNIEITNHCYCKQYHDHFHQERKMMFLSYSPFSNFYSKQIKTLINEKMAGCFFRYLLS